MIRTRIDARFAALRADNRAGFVTFLTAGDPDLQTSMALLKGLPDAGADIIELGMPFTDPMADGPAIQASNQRALAAGQTMLKTLQMVRDFREQDNETPIVLMGYYNPVHAYGPQRFLTDARAAGVDGLIIVDLPAEEDRELCIPALDAGVNFIRLLAPTTDDARLPHVLENISGFVYYVSIAGITGSAAPDADAVGVAISRIKAQCDLPVAVGFGVTEPDQAAAIAAHADAVVVGSALVRKVEHAVQNGGDAVSPVLQKVSELAAGVRRGRV